MVAIGAGVVRGVRARGVHGRRDRPALQPVCAPTIAVAVVFSVINALTLSPALCALMLRQADAGAGPIAAFSLFNRFFDWLSTALLRVRRRRSGLKGPRLGCCWSLGGILVASLSFGIGRWVHRRRQRDACSPPGTAGGPPCRDGVLEDRRHCEQDAGHARSAPPGGPGSTSLNFRNFPKRRCPSGLGPGRNVHRAKGRGRWR